MYNSVRIHVNIIKQEMIQKVKKLAKKKKKGPGMTAMQVMS